MHEHGADWTNPCKNLTNTDQYCELWKLSVFPSSIETSRALILRLVEIMNEEPDRVFNIAVSGGNTPALMFDLWANEYMDITPWDRMRIYWVDERCVPPR